MSNERLEKVLAWVTLNDPTLHAKIRSEVPNLLALKPSSVVPSNSPVLSEAAVVGSQREHAMKLDAGLNPAAPDFVEKFKQAPLSGCTTVMDMARTSARFNPLDPAQQKNLERFYDYVNRILEAPFFHLELSDRKEYHRKTKDWNETIDQMVQLFEGVAAEDQAKIREGLRSLAKAAASHSNTRQSDNLFVQNALDCGDEIRMYIYSSAVMFVEDKSKGGTTRQVDFNIARVRLRFYKEFWPEYAPVVAERAFTSVGDWLGNNSTPRGDQPVHLACFG